MVPGSLESDNYITSNKAKNDIPESADFETAISATGFGKYNALLLLVTVPATCSYIFEVTSIAYVLPSAQCDLNLTLDDKGLLNSSAYLGAVFSAFIWGYLCDAFGRKRLLVAGYFLDAVAVIMSSFSQSFGLLVASKFLGGFIINGPFAAFTTYMSEFHSSQYRARVIMVIGLVYSIAMILLPLLAWAILPLDINFDLFQGAIRMHSWNIFLLISALPSIISGIAFLFLPETPKFHMTTGKNDQAIETFQNIYKRNTNKLKYFYPIKTLINETNHRLKNKNIFKQIVHQVGPLFRPPLLGNIILVASLQTCFMLSLNTLRLWLPQIFQNINNYKYFNNGTSADLCSMLFDSNIQAENIDGSNQCIEGLDNSSVYVQVILVSCVCITADIGAGIFINFLGKKKLLFAYGITGGISGICIYFARDSTTTLILSSIHNAMATGCCNIVLSVVVDLFPTTLRTTTVVLTMMMGRVGSVVGNLIFPIMLRTGCAAPFIFIGVPMLGSALLLILLPNTDLKALK